MYKAYQTYQWQMQVSSSGGRLSLDLYFIFPARHWMSWHFLPIETPQLGFTLYFPDHSLSPSTDPIFSRLKPTRLRDNVLRWLLKAHLYSPERTEAVWSQLLGWVETPEQKTLRVMQSELQLRSQVEHFPYDHSADSLCTLSLFPLISDNTWSGTQTAGLDSGDCIITTCRPTLVL